jgi:hypothetical protein
MWIPLYGFQNRGNESTIGVIPTVIVSAVRGGPRNEEIAWDNGNALDIC